MNILHLAYRDTSGVPGRWLKAHRAAGLDTRMVVELPHPYVYGTPAKIQRWSTLVDGPTHIADDLDWADAIMVYDHPVYLEAALATGKPVLWRALGQSAREFASRLRDMLQEQQVVRATVGLPDLALSLDLPLVGAPYPLLQPADPTALVVCHAPSDRKAKGTAVVVDAVAGTPATLDLVEREANYVVMKHKRRSAIVVDSFSDFGYGVNAIEAMALGLPAVAYARPDVRDYWRRLGSPVCLVDGPDDLRRMLTRLCEDDDLRARLGEKGRRWVETFHSAAARAQEDVAALSLVAAAA